MEDPRTIQTEQLLEYARTGFHASERAIRTWFLAYAVGVPALLLSTGILREAFFAAGWRAVAASACFLTAMYVQIVSGITEKFYYRILFDRRMASPGPPTPNIADLRSKAFMALSVDLGTLILLAAGTISIVMALVAHQQIDVPNEAVTSQPALP